MQLCGTAVLLASALAPCRAFTGVRPPVVPRAPSAHARLRHVSSSSPNPLGSSSVSTGARTTGPAPPNVIRFSSPFGDVEHGDNDDEVDVMQREAEQLEAMIRGSRGIVVEAIEREWREEMLRVLDEEGEMLCSLAYEGYLDRGRGVIFVNVDMGLSSSNKGHDGAPCHAVFCSLEEVVTERSSRVKPADQMQIIQRCQEYDPEAGFVLVFGYKGMLGVQVIRPSMAPGEVFRSRRT
ncbi:unnamed protein product [Ectocarpus fasciculatus]